MAPRPARQQGVAMLEDLFQPMHLLVIFVIALLVFGPKKLPELGKGIGEGIRGFKSALKEPAVAVDAKSADHKVLEDKRNV
jgi:sec-independent protein translocase protein TatA